MKEAEATAKAVVQEKKKEKVEAPVALEKTKAESVVAKITEKKQEEAAASKALTSNKAADKPDAPKKVESAQEEAAKE